MDDDNFEEHSALIDKVFLPRIIAKRHLLLKISASLQRYSKEEKT